MLKSITTFIFLLCVPILLFSQEGKASKNMSKSAKAMTKPATAIKVSKDAEAIKTVIKKETSAFWLRDYKTWSETWVQEPYVVWTAATQDGVRQYKGWEDWSAEVKRFIKANPEPSENNILRGQWEIRVYGTGAWVSFIQDWNGSISKETRVLEKKDGLWRLAFVETLYNLNKNKSIDNE